MNGHFEHRCPNCDYTSRTEGRLKRHIKDFHSETTPDSFSGNKNMRPEETSPAQTGPTDPNNPAQPGRPKVFKCKQCDYITTVKVGNGEYIADCCSILNAR